MIINHKSELYLKKVQGTVPHNGAFFYSVEICKNIIPLVATDRNWVTINTGTAYDHSIVFIHNNLHPQNYEYLKQYDDLILVCSQKTTMENVKKYGTPIFVPLSVDVDYVKQFRAPKTKYCAYAGRKGKLCLPHRPIMNGDQIYGDREYILHEMAKYKYIYAVGRTAIEAKILGCDILPFDFRFPNPDVWKILDNKDAAEILKKELDKIDGGKNE